MEKIVSKLPLYLRASPATITVIGPVGPEICKGVPPKSEAKKPKTMAPISPAVGPSPEATPNARASGSATMADVKPPKKSNFKLENLVFIIK